ncbi:MAG TPA: TetR family transcriptional regulator, partial [Afipia sp.]|nr:TetR family transcriptional regulator [Afipia sp.]
AGLPTQAKPTASEIEMAWVFHGGIFYYGVRRYIYEMEPLQEKEEMIANAIDGYLAGFARVSNNVAKRPAVKSNRLNAAAGS